MASDLAQQKDAMRAPWLAGDFGALSRTLGATIARDFVTALGDIRGLRTLDVACGTGAVSLPMARGGAQVTGLDIAPNLLKEAREGARSEGLHISFDEAFAEEMPYPDQSFDLVTSMFGVMFSPFPDRIASELGRVTVPGGRIALANWTMNGMQGAQLRIGERYLPRPANAPERFDWGDEGEMRRLLDPCFLDLSLQRVPVRWEIPGDAADLVTLFAKTAGPMQMMLSRLSEQDRRSYLSDVAQSFKDNDRAPAGSGRISVANEYLEIKGTRRAAAG